jgi:hypothetical protein
MASLNLTSIEQINELLHGAIDTHLHFGPDPLLPRRVDAVDAATHAQEAGMRAIVLKSHSYPTAPSAYAACSHAPDVDIIGSLCLDEEVGGLNVHAVEASAALGAKVVWMPTFTASNSVRVVADSLGLVLKSTGISILDENGRLVPQANEVLEAIKEHDQVLATGHLSPAEIFALMDECKNIGLERIVITHALESNVCEKALELDQIVELARRGAFIEHCMLSCLPAQKHIMDPVEMVHAIRKIGAEQCILGTDLGVAWNPSPAEGMRMFIAILLRHGVPEKDIRRMAQTNSAQLLGLDT